jgi:hypothetical protein
MAAGEELSALAAAERLPALMISTQLKFCYFVCHNVLLKGISRSHPF